MDHVGVVAERPHREPLLLLDQEFVERVVDSRRSSCPRHWFHLLSALS
jgi:hypothetical protein